MKKIASNSRIGICMIIFIMCQSHNNVFSQSASDGITIIFNKTPKRLTRVEVAKNIFIDNNDLPIVIKDNFHNTFFEPDSTKYTDTLRIKPSSNFIMLKHSFNTVSFMYYLFRKGDTVIFSYVNNIPSANVVNRSFKKFDINYDISWRSKTIVSSTYTPYEIYLNPLLSDDKDDKKDIVNSYGRAKKRYYFLSKTLFLEEQIYLDSIKKAGEISEDYYRFYSDKCKYLAATISTEQGEINSDSAKKIMPTAENDFLPYSFYYNFILANYYYNVEKKAKLIYHSNGQIVDYREVFNNIAKDTGIQHPYNGLLLYNYLKLIANNFSIKDFEKYFTQFKKKTSDTFLVADIKARYLTDLSIMKRSASDTLYLIDGIKSNYTLGEIINKNRNKLIYIDFWASWCAPCRAAMPSSALLRNKYRNADIIFIYLSIDDDFGLWKKANTAEGLNQYGNSFFVLNKQNSVFLQKIKLTTIPRYLIFDKMGKLIHQNAPDPQSKELMILISDLIQ